MATFKSKELVFGLSFDDDDPEKDRVFLRLAGCKDKTVQALASCGRTQNKALTNTKCQKCKAGEAAHFQVSGAAGLRSLKAALREMLDRLEPVEKEMEAFEDAEAEAARVRKPTKPPAKKAAKPPARER
ncbi:MAG TPA: hypothetical protein DD490_17230 [Acidobacteria bacterium]|nr:hypothetical protein [Acidobacteriota bacterium]